ncbi:AMED_5909 family protein [Actinokineospora guangxiensis]|uniref:AMED_5909 family protein n=1 Tax=Actinokineospora guangxiensis TaxID=1490288 RepID=A0ABW0EX64_9PSEU
MTKQRTTKLPALAVGTGKDEIATLAQAHDALTRVRPSSGASAAQWEAFHRLAAQVYEAVSDVDRGHHHEARGYWAVRERRRAEHIAATGEVPSSSWEASW